MFPFSFEVFFLRLRLCCIYFIDLLSMRYAQQLGWNHMANVGGGLEPKSQGLLTP